MVAGEASSTFIFVYPEKPEVEQSIENSRYGCSLDGGYSRHSLIGDFEQFVKEFYREMFEQEDFQFVKKLLSKAVANPRFLPRKDDRIYLVNVLNHYINRFGKGMGSSHDWNSNSFWAQVIKNLKVDLQNKWSILNGTYLPHIYFSRRSRMMAENVEWILNSHKKVIVWASVTHNMRNFDPGLLKQMKWSSKTRFMGEYLEDLVGPDNLFHLTFTGYTGFYADISRNYTWQRFPKPSLDSLETRLNRTDIDFGYFILNSPNVADWLKKQFKASFVFNKEYLAKWNRSIDVVFFTRVMEPTLFRLNELAQLHRYNS